MRTRKWRHLPEASGINGLGVVLVAEVQIVNIEGVAGNTHTFRDLVIVLEPEIVQISPVI